MKRHLKSKLRPKSSATMDHEEKDEDNYSPAKKARSDSKETSSKSSKIQTRLKIFWLKNLMNQILIEYQINVQPSNLQKLNQESEAVNKQMTEDEQTWNTIGSKRHYYIAIKIRVFKKKLNKPISMVVSIAIRLVLTDRIVRVGFRSVLLMLIIIGSVLFGFLDVVFVLHIATSLTERTVIWLSTWAAS